MDGSCVFVYFVIAFNKVFHGENADMSNNSYKKYKQYRANRYQYEVDQIAFPAGIIIIGALLLQYWKPVFGIATLLFGICVFVKLRKRNIVKTTTAGYVNRNNQRNNGCTYEAGTDNNQMFYFMECLNCGCCYKANGTDIWQRKCPKCQGGKP